MKKVILPILAISMLMIVPFLVNAEPPMNIPSGSGVDIWALLATALNWFFNIAILVAALYLVFAGWQYVTAAGDEEKAKKGLNTLIYALIGVGIALLAKALIYMVSTFIGLGTPLTF